MPSFPPRPLRFTSHLHPGRVSPHCRSWYLCLTSTHVTSQLNPVPKNLHLSSTQALSQGYPALCPVSITSRSQDSALTSIHFASRVHPDADIRVSPPSSIVLPPTSSKDVWPTSMQVPSHPIQVEIWVSHPSTSCLTSTKFPDIHISPPSRSRFTSTHVQIFASLLHLGSK